MRLRISGMRQQQRLLGKYYVSTLKVSKYSNLLPSFNAAYCEALEGEELPDIFGKMDVVAKTLPEMADKIIATFN